ncbi:MAG: flotillin-like FloA family protein [Planctomycetes bacterium]|nr:flotillin-like FloA family protein [Planctomycetota bacterium]
MWFRKVPPSKVSRALSTIEDAGGTISVKDLEAHYLAGGDIQACAEAMKTSLSVGADADWRLINAVDLAGLDVDSLAHEAVQQRTSMSKVFGDRLKEHFRASSSE